jgi:nanoRNase/pAp phosphatase (c-di-AMP/oligoRNAs hydrolase)
VRFIEVKGRSAVGMVALTSNEYKKAKEMKQDYWLYVVFDCGTTPNLHAIQDPVQLGWKAVVSIEHYQVDAKKILEVSP